MVITLLSVLLTVELVLSFLLIKYAAEDKDSFTFVLVSYALGALTVANAYVLWYQIFPK